MKECTNKDLDECIALVDEVSNQKVSVEELADRCETLMELSAYTPVRDETLTVQTTYTTLLTTAQRLIFFCCLFCLFVKKLWR